MIANHAKKVINILAQEWDIPKRKSLFDIVEFLDKGIEQSGNFCNDFEFSLVEDGLKIRMLHLDFPKVDLNNNELRKNIKKRESRIISIFRKMEEEFYSRYALSQCKLLYKLNNQNLIYPIQFGLECQKNFAPTIKVYLSVGEGFMKQRRIFCFQKFSNLFGLNFKKLRELFKNKKFDTVAIDFLPNGDYFFKFYPYIHENQGYLYRILPSSEVISIKTWYRFPDGLLFEDIPEEFCFNSMFNKLNKMNRYKIHYLCKEADRRSIYFR